LSAERDLSCREAIANRGQDSTGKTAGGQTDRREPVLTAVRVAGCQLLGHTQGSVV